MEVGIYLHHFKCCAIQAVNIMLDTLNCYNVVIEKYKKEKSQIGIN